MITSLQHFMYFRFWLFIWLCGVNASALADSALYQVEMIIFERPQVSAESNGAKRDLILNYPRRWQRLYDPKTLMTLNHTETLSDTVEKTVSNPSGSSEIPAQSNAPLNTLASNESSVAVESVVPFAFLPSSKHLLAPAHQSLNRSGEFKILFHQTWYQPLISLDQSPALLLHGGQFSKPYFELQGYINLGYQGRQLMLNTHLWQSQFSTQELASVELSLPEEPKGLDWQAPELPEVSIPSENETAQVNTATTYIQHILAMNQSRKLAIGELHYLDHPKLGVLIKIYPQNSDILPNNSVGESNRE